jgi:malate synthase
MLKKVQVILTDEATEFVDDLVREFRDELDDLLFQRAGRQQLYDEGYAPDFSSETEDIRSGDWKVSQTPEILLDRRVEITGPPERKMVINALNSGANVFMADFEDSMSPTWENVIDGQINLRDAVNKAITYEHPTKGTYQLVDDPAILFVRPRGLHLKEAHYEVNGVPAPASLFDFGLFMFHNAQNLLDQGLGPFFYLPKLQDYMEARWWNKVFLWTQERLGIATGTIKATVLLETLPAAFQMDEILYELREHSAGLNCGRWDYIFSFIKTLRNYDDKILPNRNEITMKTHFMQSYVELLVYTCHHRGVHAMGGMAAQIPIRGNEEANNAALEKVRQDKLREVKLGHDGTWVAHPGLVKIAKNVFDEHMPSKNQLSKIIKPLHSTKEDLLEAPRGNITTEALVNNISVAVQYIESWLRGNGCVPLYNLMEDAATAEISRSQVWQWFRHGVKMDKEKNLDRGLMQQSISAAMLSIRDEAGIEKFDNGKYREAAALFEQQVTARDLPEFLTLFAYEQII